MATASQLAAQGIKSQYELPDWAKASGQAVDLATSGYWGPQEAGSGSGSVGSGDGSGFYSPLTSLLASRLETAVVSTTRARTWPAHRTGSKAQANR